MPFCTRMSYGDEAVPAPAPPEDAGNSSMHSSEGEPSSVHEFPHASLIGHAEVLTAQARDVNGGP